MSRWLAQALAEVARPESKKPHEPPVPLVPLVPIGRQDRPIGTKDTIGTDPDGAFDERQAMAEVEGGVPAVYSAAFAKLQLTPPPGLSVSQWFQAVDDAGRFLDAHGAQAATLGWDGADIFASAGLVRMLNGAAVVSLSASTATLSEGRAFERTVPGPGLASRSVP